MSVVIFPFSGGGVQKPVAVFWESSQNRSRNRRGLRDFGALRGDACKSTLNTDATKLSFFVSHIALGHALGKESCTRAK